VVARPKSVLARQENVPAALAALNNFRIATLLATDFLECFIIYLFSGVCLLTWCFCVFCSYHFYIG
jgi:hypothetical protein